MDYDNKEDDFDEFEDVPPNPSNWVYISGVNDEEMVRRVKEATESIRSGLYVDEEVAMRELDQILGE